MPTTNNENWFADLLMSFMPNDMDIEGKTPSEMVKSAAYKSSAVSGIATLPPGPTGFLTLLPELIAVTKIQMNLVYALAKYYNKAERLNTSIVLLIFANAVGVNAGRNLIRIHGRRVIVSVLRDTTVRELAKRVGIKITAKITSRAAGRFFSLFAAPIFATITYKSTKTIGKEAIRIFSRELETE